MDGDGNEVVTRLFEEHRGLTEELREAELLGEEKDEGVVPLTRGLLEAIEGLPEPNPIKLLSASRNCAPARKKPMFVSLLQTFF